MTPVLDRREAGTAEGGGSHELKYSGMKTYCPVRQGDD